MGFSTTSAGEPLLSGDVSHNARFMTSKLFTQSLAMLALAGGLLSQVLNSALAQSTQPTIEYRFDNKTDFANKVVQNRSSSNYKGTIQGSAQQTVGVLGNGIQMNDSNVYVEAKDSQSLNFSNGLTLEAFVRRSSNTNEDAIASKWYGTDQFLLTFSGESKGRLIFSVRHSNGTRSSVEYAIPNTSYLQDWVRVAATYNGSGRLRLYWNGKKVAEKLVSGRGMASGSNKIRIGDAGNNWSRFNGKIDEVKIWSRELSEVELSKPLRPKVLVIEYTSNNPTYNNPKTISNNLISTIRQSSKEYVQFEIVEWKKTGIRPPQRSGGGFDYAGMFNKYNICSLASKGDIHEVWVWAGPDGGMLEYAINGPWRESYGLGVGMPKCDIQMVTMGFNYERQLPEATHSFGHRLENTYRYYWGTYWNAFDGQYYRYSYNQDNQPPLQTTGQHCGNVHFPPNADRHYEYESNDVVLSNCQGWRSDGGGTYVSTNCSAWGCTQYGFLSWWMSNMPGPNNTNGPGGTVLPNWWTMVIE
jgi:hypothetical protein